MMPTVHSSLLASCLSLLVGTAVAATASVESPGAAEPTTRSEVYGQGVRETPWLSPSDELAGFHLPVGFEARLFVAEPQINKPLNMAFDSRGRMWLTQSVEYPYPAKEGTTPRDAVVVLEDSDGDGHAEKVTTFADELNIPIGVLPYGDGCLCFSIPNLWYLRDTDADGRCDRREVILGPFDTTRDTHGMINSLRDGGDGWIYACHGFNNQSRVAGRDGHTVALNSGNTFRFRPDGSRIEQITQGQVNPYGMTEDQWGYRYSADCHSKPITQLIFGACYPSFGRPHDGLGFLPPMVEHLHGSTAICGIAYYPDDSAIAPLRGQMISGNVMTSRINRNRVVYQGATAKGVELSDFMTSDDPWFRPVDLQVGPDGHLYIADFYNKIIGHYEVPLEHPERDRTSGRIWQIRYTGPDSPTAATEPSRSDDSLAAGLLAADPLDGQLADRARIQQMQTLLATGRLDTQTIVRLTADSSPVVAVAAMRLAGEAITRRLDGSEALIVAARRGLTRDNPHLVQASAELLGRYGSEQDAVLLLQQVKDVPESDPVLRQTIRIAIRNRLREAASDAAIWSRVDDPQLVSVLLGLDRPEAASVLLAHLSKQPDAVDRNAMLTHAARHSSADSIDECVRVAREITAGDSRQQRELIDVLIEARNARPQQMDTPLKDWCLDLVNQQLQSVVHGERVVAWSNEGGPWPLEQRNLASGERVLLTSSLGRSESYTGRRISDPFPAPPTIRFWIAGHNGFPTQPDHGKNRVRLIKAGSGQVLHEALPPRNDTAQEVRWNTESLRGESVQIECVDGDAGDAYAWLAIGQIEPLWLDESGQIESLTAAVQLIQRLGLKEKESELRALIDGGKLTRSLRERVVQTIADLHGNRSGELVLRLIQLTQAPSDLSDAVMASILNDDQQALLEPIKQLCKGLSLSQQGQFAAEWARSGAEIDELLQFAQWGWLSPAVLARGDAAQAINARLSPAQADIVRTLTEGLDLDAKEAQRLAQLQATMTLDGARGEVGQMLYTRHCANCHQLRGLGTVVGPQLDGAAARSVERLLEDIVTPDRNVDHAFRTTTVLMDDGRSVAGLITSETDSQITLADPTGKLITVDAAAIEQRRESGRSLMPANLAEVLSQEELRDLIHFVKGG